MAAVTGDISFNFSGLANANPFSDPLITNTLNAFKVDGGVLKPAAFSTSIFTSANSPTSNVVRAKAEVGALLTSDQIGVTVSNSSNNGYVFAYHTFNVYVRKLNAGSVDLNNLIAIGGTPAVGDQFELEVNTSTGAITAYINGVASGSTTDTTYSTGLKAGFFGDPQNSNGSGIASWAADGYSTAPQTIRKSSTFDIETALGTITTATLDGVNVFDHVSGQTGTTVSFAGAATDEITTSGEYDLVLGDGVGTETITVQVNVFGVVPSDNPLQKDGSALASLTGVQLRVTDGANLNGTELYYSGTGTTDASGNLGNIDLSSTAAADTDPVLIHMRTAAGDSIIASETVGLI